MADARTWERLGPAFGAELCGYTHADHVHDVGGVDHVLRCVRAPGHTGATVAADMHLADLGGEPVFFGDPIEPDPVDDGIMP